MRRIVSHIGFITVFALLSACGGGGGGGSGGPTEPPVVTPPPVIGTAGGTVTEAGGGASVVVPADALTSDVTIRVAKDSSGAPAMPTAMVAAGPVYAVTPHGTKFQKPVEVRIPVPAVTLQPNQRLELAKAEPGGEWIVQANVTNQNGVLVVSVDQFSYFVGIIITYPLPLPSLEPLSATLTLSCNGRPCGKDPYVNGEAAPLSVVVSWTTNRGQLPAVCAETGVVANFSVWKYGELVRESLAVADGQLAVDYPQWGDAQEFFELVIRCTAPDGRVVFNGNLAYDYLAFAYVRNDQFFRVVRSPAQVDVLIGQAAPIEVFMSGPQYFLPTNPATVDWQRSDDNGGSWVEFGTSYQNEAAPIPTVFGSPYTAWSVRRPFIVAAADQGALIRAVLCYKPISNSGATVPCSYGAPTRINILHTGELPAITTAPHPVLVTLGQTGSFSISATGLPAPTLQWQTRGANSTGAWSDVTNGTGATTGNFTTVPMTLADNGRQYRVVATNAVGTAESAPVTVSVSETAVAPTITTQPVSVTVTSGSDAVFAAVARGTESLSYQWVYNDAPITGANSPVFKLPAVTGAQAGNYAVRVVNAAGQATSDTAVLTVVPGSVQITPPVIATQPIAVTVNTGNTATFAVGATGGGILMYQWFKNGEVINGARTAYYSIPQAAAGDVASYHVNVINAAGSVTSDPATLTVNAQPATTAVAIATQPATVVQIPGGNATFAVAVTGSGPITYQWLKGGQPISGGTGGVLLLTNVTGNEAGDYSVTVTNSLGSVTSNAATLIVVGTPVITSQPNDVAANEGVPVTFNVAATGSSLRYQWLRNGVAIAGATAASYTTPALQLADSGAVYSVIVFNGAGLLFSQGAVLTVDAVVAFPLDTRAFVAGDPDHGREPWITDGTTAGTVLLKDINPGDLNSTPESFTPFGSLVMFVADDGASGMELWRTDGTEAGTYRVIDLRTGFGVSSFPNNLTVCSGRLYFGARDDEGRWLFVTDGTAAGTSRLAPIGMETGAKRTACMNGNFYAGGYQGTNTNDLWRSNGTVGGTSMVAAGVGNVNLSGGLDELTVMLGKVYFTASGRLWSTDGTQEGTAQVSVSALNASWLKANGNMLYLSASSPASGQEPWISDGTDAGTFMIKDINAPSSSFPYRFIVSNGVAYFGAEQVSGSQQMWRTDGTDAGTTMVRQITPGPWAGSSDGVVNFDGALIFNARETSTGYELWRSDGTQDGTTLVKDIVPGSSSSLPRNFFQVGAKLLFSASDGVNGEELWSTDGTEAGTVLVKDIWPGSSSSLPIP